jgi:hypothetical protein
MTLCHWNKKKVFGAFNIRDFADSKYRCTQYTREQKAEFFQLVTRMINKARILEIRLVHLFWWIN